MVGKNGHHETLMKPEIASENDLHLRMKERGYREFFKGNDVPLISKKIVEKYC
jgi:hypothetical protein